MKENKKVPATPGEAPGENQDLSASPRREIKFRVWNGEDMISPDYITRDGTAWWKENSIPTCSKKLMQYTGLKDKNGVEIYEGDVIEAIIAEYSIPTMGEIRYSKEYQAFANYNEGGCTLFFKLHTIRVIGNIYEHPELLGSEANRQNPVGEG